MKFEVGSIAMISLFSFRIAWFISKKRKYDPIPDKSYYSVSCMIIKPSTNRLDVFLSMSETCICCIPTSVINELYCHSRFVEI